MAALNLTSSTTAGVAKTPAAAGAAGDSFPYPADGITVEAINASGGAIDVTVVGQSPCNQGVTHDSEVEVPAAGNRVFKITGDQFRDSNGRVNLTYSTHVGLTLAAWQN